MFTARLTRRAAAGVAVTAIALAGATALPALAASTHHSAERTATATIRDGSPFSTVDRVADFYGAYIDAPFNGGDTDVAAALRAGYLTAQFQQQLAAWEADAHADGVLRAQDTPSHWSVSPEGAGAGHAFTRVTLTWGSVAHPDYTYLKVRSDLATGLISDIEPDTP